MDASPNRERQPGVPREEVRLGGEIFRKDQFKQGDTIAVHHGGKWVEATVETSTKDIKVQQGKLKLDLRIDGEPVKKTIESYSPARIDIPGTEKIIYDGIPYEVLAHKIGKDGKIRYKLAENGIEISKTVPQELVRLLADVAKSKRTLGDLADEISTISHAKRAELHERQGEVAQLIERAKAALPVSRQRFGDKVIAESTAAFADLHAQAESALLELNTAVGEAQSLVRETHEVVESKERNIEQYKPSKKEIEAEAKAAAEKVEQDAWRMFVAGLNQAEERVADLRHMQEEQYERHNEAKTEKEEKLAAAEAALLLLKKRAVAIENMTGEDEYDSFLEDLKGELNAANRKVESAKEEDAINLSLQEERKSAARIVRKMYQDHKKRITGKSRAQLINEARKKYQQEIREWRDRVSTWATDAGRDYDANNPDNAVEREFRNDHPEDRPPRQIPQNPDNRYINQLKKIAERNFYVQLYEKIKNGDGNLFGTGRDEDTDIERRFAAAVQEVRLSEIKRILDRENYVNDQGEYFNENQRVLSYERAFDEVIRGYQKPRRPDAEQQAKRELEMLQKKVDRVEALKVAPENGLEAEITEAKAAVEEAKDLLEIVLSSQQSLDERIEQQLAEAEEAVRKLEQVQNESFYSDVEVSKRKRQADAAAAEVRSKYEALPESEAVFDFEAERSSLLERVDALQARYLQDRDGAQNADPYVEMLDTFLGTGDLSYAEAIKQNVAELESLEAVMQVPIGTHQSVAAAVGHRFYESRLPGVKDAYLKLLDSNPANPSVRGNRESFERGKQSEKDAAIEAIDQKYTGTLTDEQTAERDKEIAAAEETFQDAMRAFDADVKAAYDESLAYLQKHYAAVRADIMRGYQLSLDVCENSLNELKLQDQHAAEDKVSEEAAEKVEAELQALRDELDAERDHDERLHLAERLAQKDIYDFRTETVERLFNVVGGWQEVKNTLRLFYAKDNHELTPTELDKLRDIFNPHEPPSEALLDQLGIADWEAFCDKWKQKMAPVFAEQLRRHAEARVKKLIAENIGAMDKFKKFWKSGVVRFGSLLGVTAVTASMMSGVPMLAVLAVVGGLRGAAMRRIFSSKWSKERQAKMMQELVDQKRKDILESLVDIDTGLGLGRVDSMGAQILAETHGTPTLIAERGQHIAAIFAESLREVSTQEALAEDDDAELMQNLDVNHQLLFRKVIARLEPIDAGNEASIEQRRKEKKNLVRTLQLLQENGASVQESASKMNPKVTEVIDAVLREQTGLGKSAEVGSALSAVALGYICRGPGSLWTRTGVGAAYGAWTGYKFGEQMRMRKVAEDSREHLKIMILEVQRLLKDLNQQPQTVSIDSFYRNQILELKKIIHGTASEDSMRAILTFDHTGKPLVDIMLITQIKALVHDAEMMGVLEEKEKEKTRMDHLLHRLTEQGKEVAKEGTWEAWSSSLIEKVWYRGIGAAVGAVSGAVLAAAGGAIFGPSQEDAGNQAAVQSSEQAAAVIPEVAPQQPDMPVEIDTAQEKMSGIIEDAKAFGSEVASRFIGEEELMTYTIEKGQGFSHALNAFEKVHSAEILDSLREHKTEWVTSLEERGQKIFGYKGDDLQEYVDKKLMHKWRVEQVQKPGFGVDIKDGINGKNTFHHTRTLHEGAQLKLAVGENGPQMELVTEDKLSGPHAERVYGGDQRAPKVEAQEFPEVPNEENPEVKAAMEDQLAGLRRVARNFGGQNNFEMFLGADGDAQAYVRLDSGKIVAFSKDQIFTDGKLDSQKVDQVGVMEAIRDKVETQMAEQANPPKETRYDLDGTGEDWHVEGGKPQDGAYAWKEGENGEKVVRQFKADPTIPGKDSGRWVDSTVAELEHHQKNVALGERGSAEIQARAAFAEKAGATPGDLSAADAAAAKAAYNLSDNDVQLLAGRGFAESGGELYVRNALGEIQPVDKTGTNPVVEAPAAEAPKGAQAKGAEMFNEIDKAEAKAATAKAAGVPDTAKLLSRSTEGGETVSTFLGADNETVYVQKGDAVIQTTLQEVQAADAPAEVEAPRADRVKTQADVEAYLGGVEGAGEQDKLNILNASRMLEERARLFGRNGENFANFARAGLKGQRALIAPEKMAQIGEELAKNNAALQEMVRGGLEGKSSLETLYRDLQAADKTTDLQQTGIPDGGVFDPNNALLMQQYRNNLLASIDARYLLPEDQRVFQGQSPADVTPPAQNREAQASNQ